jgi:hypothetical protein
VQSTFILLSSGFLTFSQGLYILSPLEEASRSPVDNFGFVISYLPSRLTTRVTSYSVRNTVSDVNARRPNQPSTPRLSQLLSSRQATRGSNALSKILSNVALATGSGTGHAVVTAAFKALPIDYATRPPDVEDPVASATTCRDAVDVMVDMMRKACADVGSAVPDFVVEKDIVRLMSFFLSFVLHLSLLHAQPGRGTADDDDIRQAGVQLQTLIVARELSCYSTHGLVFVQYSRTAYTPA